MHELNFAYSEWVRSRNILWHNWHKEGRSNCCALLTYKPTCALGVIILISYTDSIISLEMHLLFNICKGKGEGKVCVL